MYPTFTADSLYQEVMSFRKTQFSVDGCKEVVQHPCQSSRFHRKTVATDPAILSFAETTTDTGPISGCHVVYKFISVTEIRIVGIIISPRGATLSERGNDILVWTTRTLKSITTQFFIITLNPSLSFNCSNVVDITAHIRLLFHVFVLLICINILLFYRKIIFHTYYNTYEKKHK